MGLFCYIAWKSLYGWMYIGSAGVLALHTVLCIFVTSICCHCNLIDIGKHLAGP